MRKIIQHYFNKHGYLKAATCSDGLLWNYNHDMNEWTEYGVGRKLPPIPQPEKKIKGKVVKQVKPSNFDECFDQIWKAKFMAGSKIKAREKYQKMSLGESEQDLLNFTNMLLSHMKSQVGVVGFIELHLTTYLNQQRWIV